MTIHLVTEPRTALWTACGRDTIGTLLCSDPDKVTCHNCLRTRRARNQRAYRTRLACVMRGL